jgi:hypothetical protein
MIAVLILTSLGQGSFMTSAGAPEFGTFDQTLMLVSAASDPVPEGKGTLRIFITSMKDGSQQDIVDIPLTCVLNSEGRHRNNRTTSPVQRLQGNALKKRGSCHCRV